MKKSDYIEILENFPTDEERLLYIKAKRKVKEIKGFYIHLLIYIIVNGIQAFSNIVEEHKSFQDIASEQFITLILWGIVLAIHAGSVFLPNFVFGRDWEERKIKEYIEKSKY